MLHKEIIWHFTCDHCRGWWSIAVSDDWKPKKLFCTHCGHAWKNSDIEGISDNNENTSS